MITRNSVVNVLEPGAISLGRVRLSRELKFVLYALHDSNPKCTLTDLHLYIDVPQRTVVTQFNKLQKAGYVTEDGINLNIHKTAKVADIKPNPADDPARKRCMEMAEFLSPVMAAAYRLTEYNKYALAATLYKLVKNPTAPVNLEVLDRATKWIALHVNDPGFPVMHTPYLLYNKWGVLVDFKKRIDAKQAGKAYL